MTDEEVTRIANIVAIQVIAEIQGKEDSWMLLHFTEHHLLGNALIVSADRAKANPCNCFKYEGKDYCYSKGSIGLLTGDQIGNYCTAGKHYEVSPGIKERFQQFSEAAKAASQRIKSIPKGERLGPWLTAMSEELSQRGVEI